MTNLDPKILNPGARDIGSGGNIKVLVCLLPGSKEAAKLIGNNNVSAGVDKAIAFYMKYHEISFPEPEKNDKPTTRNLIIQFLQENPGWHTGDAIAASLHKKPASVKYTCSLLLSKINKKVVKRVTFYSIKPS